MVPQLSNNNTSKQQQQLSNNNTSKQQQQQSRTTTADATAKVNAPPALRITRKLTRPERQLKLEQHLDEQLERINENRSDKETNTECVFMHPNQSTMMRMRVQQSKNDPNYLTVKRSQTFNTTVCPEGQEESSDYVCRVRK